MARIEKATLEPSKAELLGAWLSTQAWAPAGEPEIIAAYRFDDPAGKVGIESFLLAVGDRTLHVPLSYREAPLDGAAEIGTMAHSVLGRRWVYDGCTDPVAVRAFLVAMATGGQEAALEVYDGDQLLAVRDPEVRVSGSGGAAAGSVPAFDQVEVRALGESATVVAGGHRIDVLRVVDGAELTGEITLTGRWRDRSAVLAAASRLA